MQSSLTELMLDYHWQVAEVTRMGAIFPWLMEKPPNVKIWPVMRDG